MHKLAIGVKHRDFVFKIFFILGLTLRDIFLKLLLKTLFVENKLVTYLVWILSADVELSH